MNMKSFTRTLASAQIGTVIGGTIGGIKEGNKSDGSGNVAEGIVGGAILGGIAGSGVSIAKRKLDNKLRKEASQAINESSQNIIKNENNTAQQMIQKQLLENTSDNLSVANSIAKTKPGNTHVKQKPLIRDRWYDLNHDELNDILDYERLNEQYRINMKNYKMKKTNIDPTEQYLKDLDNSIVNPSDFKDFKQYVDQYKRDFYSLRHNRKKGLISNYEYDTGMASLKFNNTGLDEHEYELALDRIKDHYGISNA